MRSLILMAAVALFASQAFLSNVYATVGQYPLLPIRTVIFEVAEESHDAFFDRLGDFAGSFGFTIRVGRQRPDRPNYMVEILRPDVQIVGTNGVDIARFELSFYAQIGVPVPSIAKVDELIEGLESTMTGGSGWSIVEIL